MDKERCGVSNVDLETPLGIRIKSFAPSRIYFSCVFVAIPYIDLFTYSLERKKNESFYPELLVLLLYLLI